MTNIQSISYLTDYATKSNVPHWMKNLIYKVVQKSDVLDESEIEDVLNDLNSQSTATLVKPTMTTDVFDLALLDLKHKKGVNALKPDQTLVFCEEGLTFIYGQNGSGKSGYFRILHEIAGGKIPHKIHGNIYDTSEAISVELKYRIDNQERLLSWNGSPHTVQEMRYLSVFDQAYADMIIKDRTSEQVVLNPKALDMMESVYLSVLELQSRVDDTSPKMVEVALQCQLFEPKIYFHDYVLTLQQAFQDELDEFGLTHLQVSIMDEHATGIPKLLVRLPKNYQLEQVLSEGELKCIALSMFLAERKMQPANYPIIFDDPVNSLDHLFIGRFVEKVAKLPNQVIIFSHQILLKFEIEMSDKIHTYKAASLITDRVDQTAKHTIIEKIIGNESEKGFVLLEDDETSRYYLNEAEKAIRTYVVSPSSNIHLKHIANMLRIAIEYIIDEKIFLGLIPNKVRVGKSGIQWKDLKKMSPHNTTLIEKLKVHHGNLSSRLLHVSGLSTGVPLRKSDLESIYNDLIQL